MESRRPPPPCKRRRRDDRGDIQGSLEAQFKLAPLRIAFNLGTFPAVIKESLELLGIDAGACMAPVGPMSTDEKQQLKKILTEMGS